MARTYGAIYLDIWRDKDFRALTHTEQYLYWALIFQFQLNGAGLLDYMPDRWAEATSDMTTADVEMTIKSLIAKRYVVHDPSTHELLVRTYVRNSKVWKMPKAFAGVIPAAAQIQSSKLRRVLLADLNKIPLGELSEAPASNGGPSVRAKVDGYLVKLRAVLDDGEPDDPAGLDEPDPELPEGYEPDAERVSVPNACGTDTDSANPITSTRVRARAVPVQVHVPVQVLTPLAPDALFDVEVPASPTHGAAKPRKAAKPKAPAKAKPPVDPEVAARNKLAVELAQEWYDAQSPKPTGKFVAYQQIVYRLLEAEHDPDAVAEALKRCGFALTLPAAEFKLKKIQEERDRVVVPFQRRGAHEAYRNDPDKDRSAGFPGATIYEGA